jgi:O-antigen ligase
MKPGKRFVKAKTFLVEKMDWQNLATRLTYAAVFLLPWQARWIYATVFLNGEGWEYGKLCVYTTEVVLLVATILRGRPPWAEGFWRMRRVTMIFLGTCFLSLSFAWFFQGSLSQLLHVCFAYALFSLVLDTRVSKNALGWSFVLGLIAPSILAWVQSLTGVSPASTFFGIAFQDASLPGTSVIETVGGRMLRAYGFFPHPNIFGGFLAVAFFILLNLEMNKKRTWVAWTLSALLGSAFVLTFSRNAWLALMAGAIVGMVIWWRSHMSFPSQVKTIAYFFLVGCLIAGSIFSQAIFARFDAEERLEVISVSERLSGYAQWNEVFLKNPVTGVGVGGYTAALATITPGQSAWAYQPVHNVFLLILSEIGLLGFVAFFWWVISVGKSLRTEAQGFMISLGTCLFFLALFDHYLWSLWPGLALSAFVFAMILRGSRAP